MDKVGRKVFDIRHIDSVSVGGSFVHRIDPCVKLITAIIYIMIVVSFDKYAVSALIPFIIYPVVLAVSCGLSFRFLLRKILIVLPFAFFVGIFNPILDRTPAFYIGHIVVSGGWISFLSIILKFFLTVSAALILVASTGFNSLCLALEKLKTPQAFVIQILFLYRYLFVLTDETERMIRARAVRSFSSKLMRYNVFVLLVGNLLIRTIERAQRIYSAMISRGFNGQSAIIRDMKIGWSDRVFIILWVSLFVFLRFNNIAVMLGSIITGGRI